MTTTTRSSTSSRTASTLGETWIPSTCNMCFNSCSILVKKVDGVVTKIEGDPRSPVGEGRVCGKGATAMMQLYDPHRITKPMKRTNPIKAADQDPGWVEISWDEAYDIMVREIRKAIDAKGYGNICNHSFITNFAGTFSSIGFWNMALKSPNFLIPDICGAAIHGIEQLLTTGCNAAPDYDLCRYVLQFGSQAGTATRHGFNMTVRRFADARRKGCKLVNVDPRMSAGAQRADRWVPIRPGTDTAMALSIAYTLVHELGIYDREYLQRYTNAAALVDDRTQRIIRDPESNKPLVWSLSQGAAAPFDQVEPTDMALEGQFEVDAKPCRTGFQCYADLLQDYRPEDTEPITTVPAETVRQVAAELGEAAGIGQTITIDGVEYPYRPVCVDSFSGISRHKHAFLGHWSILSLNTLLGSLNVPGGFIAYAARSHGSPQTGLPNWEPTIWEEDGLFNGVGLNFGEHVSTYESVREGAHNDETMAMFGLMPMNDLDPHFLYLTQMDPEKYGRQKMDMLFVYAGNPVKNWGNHDEMGEFLKTFEFVAGMDLYLNDSSYFFDLIIPEATFLERYDYPPTLYNNHRVNGSLTTPWAWGIRQPVVESRDGAPSVGEFYTELADRLGITAEWNEARNFIWNLQGENRLDPQRRYPFEEVLDAIYKNWFGPEHDLEWFKRNGVIKWDRKPEEVYLLPHQEGRVPFYFDFMLEAKESVAQTVAEMGLDDWELDDYIPLPEYKPCPPLANRHGEYDLFPIYYTNAMNVDTWGLLNPWINEINESEPYGYNIEINAQTAASKGLRSGDHVRLVAENGFEVNGRIILVQGLHPEAVAVGGGCWGIASEYQPVAQGRGVSVNNLLEAFSSERLDHVSAAYDQCVCIKIEKL